MSIIVKDANGDNKYFKTSQVGDATNPFLSIPADFYLEIVKGNIAGHKIVQKFGAIENVTTTLTPVTTSGKYPTPTTPTSLEVVSSSADDTAGGTGARTLTIEGISNTNGAWTEEVQTIALNGTTAVSIPNQMLRVYRLYITSTGTYGTETTPSHSSTITVRESGGGATWQVIESIDTFGEGQSEIAAFTIPKGKTGYILNKQINVEGTKSANIFLFKREGADTVVAPFIPMRVKELDRNLSGSASRKPSAPILKCGEASDVGFMAQSTSVTTSLSIEFEILLIDN